MTARALSVHVPRESVLVCQPVNDIGRLLALQWRIVNSPGGELSDDLSATNDFVIEDLGEYLGTSTARSLPILADKASGNKLACRTVRQTCHTTGLIYGHLLPHAGIICTLVAFGHGSRSYFISHR